MSTRYDDDYEDRPGNYDEQDAAMASWYSNTARHERQERTCFECCGTGLDLTGDSGGSCPACIGGVRFD